MPKWSHLRDVHKALLLCRKSILGGVPTVQKLNEFHEIRTYEKPGTEICAAFITNNHTTEAATITFRGNKYLLPAHSISVLPDCKTVVYNTQSIVSQHNARNFERSPAANNFQWKMFSEAIPTTKKLPINQKLPAELYSLLKDTTDYAWYTTRWVCHEEEDSLFIQIIPLFSFPKVGYSILVIYSLQLRVVSKWLANEAWCTPSSSYHESWTFNGCICKRRLCWNCSWYPWRKIFWVPKTSTVQGWNQLRFHLG